MNAYDFDGTIYDGDSTIDFYLFCLRKKPSILLCFPKQLVGFFLYSINRISKTKFKELFFCFLKRIDILKYVSIFWDENNYKIMKWYRKQKKEDDVLISASPDFLLKPICQRLGIQYLVATKFDTKSCKIIGENCYGKNKAFRLLHEFESITIEEFYSDSDSDLPMARLAKKAYKVKKGKIHDWTGNN